MLRSTPEDLSTGAWLAASWKQGWESAGTARIHHYIRDPGDAYGSLQGLQSSLNSEEGLGVASLSVIYGALILSSVLLPPILIKNLGSKWTIVASMGCYVAYFLGNIYPVWATLIPTSVILGLGGAPLWSAKCTYLTISAHLEAGKDAKRARDLVNEYFGIFFLMFQSSAVWGNLMSALIFRQDSNTAEITEEDLRFCGAAGGCEYTATGNSTRPAQNLVNMLLGSYVAFGVLGMILVAVLLDDIDGDVAQTFRRNREPLGSVILATFTQLKDRRQLLLIPLTIYSGLEQAFLSGDYNKREAAFSNYRMWESTGFVIAFAYSNFLCLSVKLYILIGALVVSMGLYGWVENQERKSCAAGAQNRHVTCGEDKEEIELTA
ncbi:hypothetical protein AAFF_G00361430 [Aldrovandia affinis]|uniref:Protein unc-93 homolog A n=1 Tax=Aldrovandia affinis TaxID=143900 RepID=A0AAD7SHR9_9TELE|nr:hypothetical protein AAFF_G00361430 [Aldrovandia affinis]